MGADALRQCEEPTKTAEEAAAPALIESNRNEGSVNCATDCAGNYRTIFAGSSPEADPVSLDSCEAGCKLPNAAKAPPDDVDEYCHTLTLPSVDFQACKKGADALRQCEAPLLEASSSIAEVDCTSDCASVCEAA